MSTPADVSRLLSESTTAARLRRLEQECLADVAGLTWLLDRVEEMVHDDPAVADELAELCAAGAGPAGLPAVSARAHYLRARVHAERGELDRALELIAAARAGWLASGRPVSALRTDLGRMQVLDDLGRHRDAAALGETLLIALDQLDSDDLGDAEDTALVGWLRATTLNNLGVAYSFLGEHERTIEAYAGAEAAYTRLGLPAETAMPRANRGIELLQLGRAREARDVLLSASDMFAAAGDRLWTAKCAGSIGQAQLQLGELVDALQVLEPARTTLDELGAGPEAARVQLAIAEVYLAAGLCREAHAEAAEAAERTSAAGMRHDAAAAAFTMAQADLGANNLDAADAGLRCAAELFENVGDRQYQARAQLARADVAAALEHHGHAAQLAAAAASALAAGGWQIPLAWAKLRQSDLAAGGAADAHLDEAVELIDRLQLPQLRLAGQLRLARRRRREGQLAAAETLLRQAIDIAEQMSGGLPDPVLRTAFRTDKLAAYDDLVELLITRGGDADLVTACRIGDRAKAQTLIDMITGTVGVGRGRAAGASTPAPHLEQLHADLSATYGAMMTAVEPSRRALVQRRAEDLERQLSVLRLRQTIGESRAGPSRPDAAPDSLPREPTLAYHVVGDDVIAFLARSDAVKVRRIAGVRAAVDHQLDLLTGHWNRFRFGTAFVRRNMRALVTTTQQTLGELYRLLVGPVRDLLAEVDGRQLVVVPHRRLHQLPFHALHDGAGYLAERWAVTLAPTITRTPTAVPAAPPGGHGILVLAVPDAQAPSISTEAHALTGFPGSRVLVGAEATSTAIRELVPGPGVVHIACHGIYRQGNPLFSALRLADRWLTSAEILELDLGGALVTLSSCESGRHSTSAAEPVGLARAFLAAGASGAVASQWIVDDGTTAELMAGMYGQIAAGLGPAEALRRAQLAIMADYPHPYYWAPFSYVASPAAAPIGANRVQTQ
jgi:tetratricopeptide (TPR) repeat protein